ncbi:MAG: hypothetical protein NT062_38105 [Proteobacteria bacterium]|nr:hypothetical protein [Pseudomonadota bacterium]
MVLLIGWFASVAAADAPRQAALGFDHMVHDRTIVISTGAAIPCVRCPVDRGGRLVGRPDHATCFGACHGAPPKAPPTKRPIVVPPERAKLCAACHSEASLVAPFAGSLPVAYPPYAIDPDFSLVLGHRQHLAIACTQCHAETQGKDGRMRAPPHAAHARCLGCHDGLAGHGPTMTRCETCHQRAAGAPQPPSMVEPTLPMGATFSHKAHASRAAAGKACATCHAAVIATDDVTLPRPTAKTCAIGGCHDAKAAFAITTACTKCHREPPKRSFEVARPVTRFLHALPAHAAARLPCASCHRLAPSGEIVAGDHAACSGCHDEFGSTKPTICGACHNSTEPWRALTADRTPPATTEFGASLDHGTHAATPCLACHRLRTGTRELRPPRGHGSCTTAGCHAVTGGPAPQLADCTGCHQRGFFSTREATRATAAWSVRNRFSHAAAHRLGRDGAPLPCTTCHDDLRSPTVMALATPAKPRCAPCHDGATAFKLTGTACVRCHGARR